MNAQAFWNVIGNYNEQTKILQIGLLISVIVAIALSYMRKVNWAAKFALGITNLFIGIAFFAWYGTEPIQRFFALPLYLLCGILFLYESWHNKDDQLDPPSSKPIDRALSTLSTYIFCAREQISANGNIYNAMSNR